MKNQRKTEPADHTFVLFSSSFPRGRRRAELDGWAQTANGSEHMLQQQKSRDFFSILR
jgi:hypothetical protein